jgi:[acyl-carrier-protein] S-malonyltransferase
MGKALADIFPPAATIMERADTALGIPLSTLCYEGPEEELSATQNTQPALLTVSAMALEVFRGKCGIKPDFVTGHSLGEFSAIYAGGGLTFEESVGIVRNRGLYMSKSTGGVMAAVLGLDADKIEEACREATSEDSFIQPANYNGSGQTVIAGVEDALERVTPLLKERGAKRVLRLKVSGAFHTPLMSSASERLAVDLDRLAFSDTTAKLVNNVDAALVTGGADLREGLKRQVMGAVRWTGIMDTLVREGVKTVVEFGPGKTLIGMFKRVDSSLTLCNVEDEESLNRTLEVLG